MYWPSRRIRVELTQGRMQYFLRGGGGGGSNLGPIEKGGSSFGPNVKKPISWARGGGG